MDLWKNKIELGIYMQCLRNLINRIRDKDQVNDSIFALYFSISYSKRSKLDIFTLYLKKNE